MNNIITDIKSGINYGRQTFSSLPPKLQYGIKVGLVGVAAFLILPIALNALGFHTAAGIITGTSSLIIGTVSLIATGASILISLIAIGIIVYLGYLIANRRPLPF